VDLICSKGHFLSVTKAKVQDLLTQLIAEVQNHLGATVNKNLSADKANMH
jgi:hypothetical protein